MTVLDMRLFGDPILRSKSSDVLVFDDALAKLAADMMDTMLAAPGVGLAAPQVGIPKRVVTYDDTQGNAGVLVNAEIAWSSEEIQEAEEGCLSIPGVYLPVVRALRVRVRAQDLRGASFEIEGEGLLARIFQHEIDHTDGILFVDRLTPERRKEAMRLIREQELGTGPAEGARPAPAL